MEAYGGCIFLYRDRVKILLRKNKEKREKHAGKRHARIAAGTDMYSFCWTGGNLLWMFGKGMKRKKCAISEN